MNIKTILNRKPKQQDPTFTKEPPLSGGNAYINKKLLDAQVEIDLNNVEGTPKTLKSAITAFKKFATKSESKAKDFITARTLQPYFLLQLQANYFCNTIEFECNNNIISEMTYKIIRAAFLTGAAGLFKNLAGNLQPLAIVNTIIDSNGNAIEYEVMPADNAIASQSQPNTTNKTIFKINGEQIKNFITFKWGTTGLSAWLLMYPFILQQQSMLTMLNTLSFSYLKKYVYKVNDPTSVDTEMELFFDPYNPFIVDAGISNGLGNKFSSFEMSGGNASQKDFIEYYNESIKIWYELFGRKNNKDDKKERNVSSEVEATQAQYKHLQNEYKNQFQLYVNRLLAANFIPELEMKTIDELEKEKDNLPKEVDQNVAR